MTGAVAGRTAPTKLLPPSYGVWHRAVVTLDGRRLRVEIDGELVRDTTVEGQATGFVSFARLGHPFEIWKMEIEELPGVVRWDRYDSIDGWGRRDVVRAGRGDCGGEGERDPLFAEGVSGL